MRRLIRALTGLAVFALAGCAGEDGPAGAPPLSVATLVAVPPVVPVGVQAMVAATLGNVDADAALEVEWTVEPAALAVVRPSTARALFFVPLEPTTFDVRVRVTDGDRVAEGQAFVQAASAGSGVAQADADQDGLFDAWEEVFFGAAGSAGPAVVEPGDDPDGDGRDNAREQEDGTDPTRPDAAPPAAAEGDAA